MKVCSVCRRCYDDAVLSCTEENHEESLVEARAAHAGIVPNYELEFLQESTPAGEIYRAESTILKKPYLIKIVPPEAFDEGGRKQFLGDAQSLASIIHPNVVRVFESGVLADGSLYAVTELVAAQSLRECLENVGAPSEVTALTIVRQAAEGLEAMHAEGVLHRAVRPENIILTADAENRFLIKLQNIDFGALAEKYALAAPEPNIGALRYFSPEQCASEETDAQTDVYSLGIVLYEALAGRVPFDSPYADAIIKKQIAEPPPEIKIHSFDIRMLLTHTLTDALQKQTRTRLKSANAFARRIRHIEQLATHSSTPPPAVAYPATMNRAAVVFTPPAKTEKVASAPKVEPAPENPLPVPELETFAAAEPAAFETQPALEDLPVVEEIEVAAPFEAETTLENPAVEEMPSTAENLPLVEDAPTDATPPAAEYLFEAEPLAEEPAATETRAVFEAEPLEARTALEDALEDEPEAQTAFEAAPDHSESIPETEDTAQPEAVFESAPPIETPEILLAEEATADDAADLPPIEAQAAFEAGAAFENAVPVEDSPTAAEVSAESENQPLVEAPAEIQPAEAAALQIQAEAAERAAAEILAREAIPLEIVPVAVKAPGEIQTSAEPVFIDYTTTKLPPVETIVGKRPPENIPITEIEPIFTLKGGQIDIHKTSEPVLVDWEQPDDVPTTTQALSFTQKKAADAAFFAPNADVIEEEDESIEADEPDAEIEAERYAPQPARAAERPFFSYDDSRTTWQLPEWSLPEWNLPDKRKVLTGAGILALVVVAVGGTLLSRQFLAARASRQTTAQSSTTDKTLPKTVEPAKLPDAVQPAAVKTESVTPAASSTDETALPDLPDYQPRGETEAKTALPAAAENRGKKRVLKEAVEKLEQAVQNKPATSSGSATVFDKKGNAKPAPDKKPAVKNKVSTPAKTDIFTRPRIVKTQ